MRMAYEHAYVLSVVYQSSQSVCDLRHCECRLPTYFHTRRATFEPRVRCCSSYICAAQRVAGVASAVSKDDTADCILISGAMHGCARALVLTRCVVLCTLMT